MAASSLAERTGDEQHRPAARPVDANSPAVRGVSSADDTDSLTPDETLISAISDGDRDAFAVLLKRHLDSIHAYLLRMTGSRADAEDLAQETFLRVWRKAGTYQPGKVKATTWLHTIAHNVCIDAFRKQREVPVENVREEVDDSADPAHLYRIRAQHELLNSAIARLPDNQRSAILLCQVQGFSNAQAAGILGINLRALESLLARARRSLRTELFASENVSA